MPYAVSPRASSKSAQLNSTQQSPNPKTIRVRYVQNSFQYDPRKLSIEPRIMTFLSEDNILLQSTSRQNHQADIS